MEKALVAKTAEKVVWYSRDDRILSFHAVADYTKKIFANTREMFRFVLGLVEIGFRLQ